MALIDAANRALRQLLIARGVVSHVRRVRDHSVHFYRLPGRGLGPPVLLVHGLGSSANAFARIIPALARRFREVWALDLPGNGFSPLPNSGPVSVREQVEVLLAFRNEVVGQPVFLIGNSLGGAMSLFAAHRAPEAVVALGLIAPAGAPMSDDRVQSLRRALNVTTHAEARAMTRRLFHRVPVPILFFAGELRHLYGSPTVKATVAELTPAEAVTPEMLRNLKMPVLLIWGQSERLLPYEGLAYFRAHLPAGAQIEEVPGFGHMPQMEHPRAVVKRLIRFADAHRLGG